jgi:hypothetical protein
MTIDHIFSTFKSLSTGSEKADYLRVIAQLNLHYDINYDNLIKYWEGRA